MDKISYDEFLDALEKVNIFHRQIRKEGPDEKNSLNAPIASDVNSSILELLRRHATNRIIDAVRLFLESEKSDRKLPFSSTEDVSIVFFVERYTLNQLKIIRSIGPGSLILLDRILTQAGYRLRER
ncbi:hypothetical protein CPT03_12140 [Pedobacter ginsengisoli]|uniref:Uncharacterized protein n=1 Tax=Pedobacter ginsengisoli TaxID=363852 RepID=A0A2D1U6F6_9SPHI|nr:hypothetical protein CPT03_12140 [Pedobacter ginsengisoli]